MSPRTALSILRRVAGRREERSLANGALRVRVWDERLLASVQRLLDGQAWPPAANPQLTLTEFPRWRARALSARGHIVLPKFVSFELDSGSKKLSRDVARRWNSCGARQFSVSIRRDPRSFQFFYERLYLPTLEARRGADAYRRPRDYLLRGFKRGYLLFLSRADRVVAGALNVMRQRDDTAVDHWAGGVLDGDGSLVRDGADVALVLRSREWAGRIGANRLGLTQTQPFARDGLFAFKTGFRPTLYCRNAYPTVLALGVREWSPGARSVMDCLSPISFGRTPMLWRCGGSGLREPEGLQVLDLEAELHGQSSAAALRQLRLLARRTKPNRRILPS